MELALKDQGVSSPALPQDRPLVVIDYNSRVKFIEADKENLTSWLEDLHSDDPIYIMTSPTMADSVGHKKQDKYAAMMAEILAASKHREGMGKEFDRTERECSTKHAKHAPNRTRSTSVFRMSWTLLSHSALKVRIPTLRTQYCSR